MTGIGVGAGLGVLAGKKGLTPYAPGNLSSDYDSTNYINFGEDSACEFQAGGAKSAGIWVRRLVVTLPPASEVLMGRFDRSSGSGEGWNLFFTASGKLSFDLTTQDPFRFIRDISDDVITGDMLWHLAVVTKSTNDTWASLNLYWDGVPLAHSPSWGGLAPGVSDYAGVNFCIGSTSDLVEEVNKAHMCHSFIIDGELSAAQVALLYSLSAPVDLDTASLPGSISHWCTLGNGCTTGAGNCPDLSPEASHGTASGGMLLADLQIADFPP